MTVTREFLKTTRRE